MITLLANLQICTEITFKQLKKVVFPIYRIPFDDIYEMDGLVKVGGFLLDDRNQIGTTIGIRRLQSPHKLLRLNFIVRDVSELLLSKKRLFIDTKGFIFIYRKTRRLTVIPHKILKISHKDTYSVLTISGVYFPILVNIPPPEGFMWINIVYFGKIPSLPYNYSATNCKPFKRML